MWKITHQSRSTRPPWRAMSALIRLVNCNTVSSGYTQTHRHTDTHTHTQTQTLFTDIAAASLQNSLHSLVQRHMYKYHKTTQCPKKHIRFNLLYLGQNLTDLQNSFSVRKNMKFKLFPDRTVPEIITRPWLFTYLIWQTLAMSSQTSYVTALFVNSNGDKVLIKNYIS